MLTKEQILTKTALQTRSEPSELFGGELCLQELARGTFRAVVRAARLNDDEDSATVDTDKWNGGIFAALVVDPETKQPLFTTEEVLAMANRADVWDEILRVATIGLNFSEIGQEALKKT
jgi:hypothetical protein